MARGRRPRAILKTEVCCLYSQIMFKFRTEVIFNAGRCLCVTMRETCQVLSWSVNLIFVLGQNGGKISLLKQIWRT